MEVSLMKKRRIGISWLSRCSVCGCGDMDCWGRCRRCGSDMHKQNLEIRGLKFNFNDFKNKKGIKGQSQIQNVSTAF